MLVHYFFFDDLRLYASSTNTAKKQLDLVTAFSQRHWNDFGDNKSAYQQIQNRKLLHCTYNLEINQLSIKPMKKGDTYKYIGICKNISCWANKQTLNYKGILPPNKKDMELRTIIVQ